MGHAYPFPSTNCGSRLRLGGHSQWEESPQHPRLEPLRGAVSVPARRGGGCTGPICFQLWERLRHSSEAVFPLTKIDLKRGKPVPAPAQTVFFCPKSKPFFSFFV